MLLKDLLMEFEFNCQCRKLSPRTIKNYIKQIGYLLNYLEQEHQVTELEAVQALLIRKFLLAMSNRGRKEQYVNDLLKAFKCYFKYAYTENYTDVLITDRIKNIKPPKTVIKTFTNANVKRMVEFYKGNDYLSIRNKAIICIFFDTGMRLNEVRTLTDEQIKDEYILVHGKGDKERVVPKSPLLAKLLFRYINNRNSFFAYKTIPPNTFLSRTGRPLTHEMMERIVKKAGEYAGVSEDIRVSPHTCRHTFAQMQLKNGLDLYTLSRLMGHENISITQRYLEGIKDIEVLKAATKTSPLMNL